MKLINVGIPNLEIKYPIFPNGVTNKPLII